MSRAPEFTSISPKVLTPRLPRIGNIKLGGLGPERTSGQKKWRLPQKYDHIKVTLRARDKSGNFVLDEDVHRKIGEKPRSLNVVLMFNEPQHNWQYSFVAYEGKRLRYQGNGERAYDRELGSEIPCTCPLLKVHEGDYPADIKRPIGKVTCKPYGVLSVLLPDAESYGGFYVFRTTSWEMISTITASLQLFYQQFGGLAFLPLRLELNPVLDTYEENGQTKTSTTWKASLVLAGSIDTAFQLASGAQQHRETLRQLSAGNTYTPEQHVEQLREIAREDEGDVAEEYFSNAGDVVDAEFEIETEMDPLERHIRYACEIAGADPIKVNQSIVAHEGRLVELAEKTQALLAEMGKAEAWTKAKERIEAEAAADEHDSGIVEEQREEASTSAPVTAMDSLDLFGS